MATLESALKQQLKQLLDGKQAHAPFSKAVHGLDPSLHSIVPQHLPYSAWQIVEHIRITQRDILDFSRNDDGAGHPYQPREWPASYWPKSPTPPDDQAWNNSILQIEEDRKAFDQLLDAADAGTLTAPFPWGNDQTLLREALLIADHTAYHTGELIVLRRLLGAWE